MFGGIILNLFVLAAARNMSSMNGSFGIITKNHAICNLTMCLLYVLVVCPMQLSWVFFELIVAEAT